jgi:hypothetical protein
MPSRLVRRRLALALKRRREQLDARAAEKQRKEKPQGLFREALFKPSAVRMIARSAGAEKTNQQTENAEHRANEASLAQSTRTIARFTTALVFVGILSALVSCLQWHEMSKSGTQADKLIESNKTLAAAAQDQASAAKIQAGAAKTASETEISAERARFFVIPDGIKRAGDKDRNPAIPFTMINLGRTAAVVKGILTECAVVLNDGSLSPIPIYNSKKLSLAMSIMIGGAIMKTPSGHECTFDNPITDDDFAGLAIKARFILFKGFVRFQDIFGNTWQKRFGVYSFGDGLFLASKDWMPIMPN